MPYAIGQIERLGRTLYVLADECGRPRSFGYRTREQAECVARMLESADGSTMADCVTPLSTTVDGEC